MYKFNLIQLITFDRVLFELTDIKLNINLWLSFVIRNNRHYTVHVHLIWLPHKDTHQKNKPTVEFLKMYY